MGGKVKVGNLRKEPAFPPRPVLRERAGVRVWSVGVLFEEGQPLDKTLTHPHLPEYRARGQKGKALTRTFASVDDVAMPSRRDHDRRLLGFARELRANSTDAEKRLWRILRNRKLARYKFRRQYPIEGYIVDFYWISAGLVIELDGGQHNEPAAKEYDARRTQRLKQLGIKVLRFWDHDLPKHSSEVAESIYRSICGDELPSPQPTRGRSPIPLASAGVRGEGAK